MRGHLLLVSLENHVGSLCHHFASVVVETFTPAPKCMTDRTDSSAHRRLLLDGRLAGSSCLGGALAWGLGGHLDKLVPGSRVHASCLRG